MSLDDHGEMLGLIKQIKGMVMLCGYAPPAVRRGARRLGAAREDRLLQVHDEQT